MMSEEGITYDILKEQNATTSNAIIKHYEANDMFKRLSEYEGKMTIKRDEEDDKKLQKGIEYAQSKGVLDPKHVPEPYTKIDVLGKTPSDVADEIISKVGSNNGGVIVICGLSGTGKGTTVSKLREKIESSGSKVVTWSNGNIFRSLTLLAATWCEQNGCDGFDADKALTKSNLQDFTNMLSFGKNKEGKYDTKINGLGLELYVSDIQNTTLKEPKVSKNIPTVAQYTQGEAVLFAAKALKTLSDDGYVVLLEGREQTVNYVPTPYRFTLILSDDTLIGKRRAAQRLMGSAIKQCNDGDNTERIVSVLDDSLKDMNDEIDDEESNPSTIVCTKFFSWLLGGTKKKN